jgi:hypothetical protein
VYCSNCGAHASGNFCAACGSPLAHTSAPPAHSGPWQQEVRYAVITSVPEVRERVAAHAAAARAAVTGEQFLELADKALAPLMGGVSLSTVTALAAPIYARLGIRTGKTRDEVLSRPTGAVLGDLLCFLAASGYAIKRVQQGDDGCVMECTLPSDWRSFAGELVVTVERAGDATAVRAATVIPSQLYDWGKSNKILERLFSSLGGAQTPA